MNEGSHDIVLVPVVAVTAQTEKAILIQTDEGEFWIPLSQIVEDESEVWKKGDSGFLAIPRWLAEEKDLHYEE